MSQSKADLEEFYKDQDPWDYKTNFDDLYRRKIICKLPQIFLAQPRRVLDIGCGEGFITELLPGKEIFGIELSDTAAARLPKNVTRIDKPEGKYDLIIACGVLYEQYDYKKIREWIEDHASNLVITCHYDQVGEAHDMFQKDQILYAEFPYKEGVQILRVYQW